MTDESLMLSVKNDDLEKAAVLYERYKLKLYRYFMAKSGNDTESSEDAVQMVFYRMLKYRSSYKEQQSFQAWVFRIAKNVIQQEFNQRLRDAAVRDESVLPDSYESRRDEHNALRQAVSYLPEDYREVLMMSKFLDMKYEEIAEVNQCTVGTVKVRIFRAMKSLKEIYEKIA